MRKTKRIEMGNPRDPDTQTPPADDQIRQRAYEIFQARGGEPGHGLDDWLHAERELKEELKAT